LVYERPVGSRWRRGLRRAFAFVAAVIALAFAAAWGYLFWHGNKAADTTGEYVALGSSFAAGIGIGPRAPGSPIHCMRTSGGYPALVAKRTGLRLVDMSCSGSTTGHILDGGQLMLGPQLAAIGPRTRLVTITSGGNDVGYVGDLMVASGDMGLIGAWLHGDIQPASTRPYGGVSARLETIVRHIRRKSPKAVILVVNYPALLPVKGKCAALAITGRQAAISREVAGRLAQATRQAADRAGALLIDMDAAGAGHDACSAAPWVHGAKPASGTAFHPNAAGAAATADRIVAALQP
jgi:lysophospholipase L1-like esterase